MTQVREEQRAGRTPEQELRDALTAIRPLLERDDVEEAEWVAAFEKEVPILVDAAYRFLAAGAAVPAPPAGLTVERCAHCERPMQLIWACTGGADQAECHPLIWRSASPVSPGAPAAARDGPA